MAKSEIGVFRPISKEIGETITVYSDKKIQFRDSGIYIQSSVDGTLNIVADTILSLSATTITTAGAWTNTGNFTVTGDLTVTGDFLFGNAAADTMTVAGDIVYGSSTAAYLIDMNAATPSTADIRFSNGATAVATNANTLTITEATISLVCSTGITLDGDISVDGAHTFTTGTGAVGLNGSVILATTKTYTSGTASAIGGTHIIYQDGAGNKSLEIIPGTSIDLNETNITLTGAIKLDGTVTLDDDGTIADASDIMTLTQDTITLAGATKINLDGPVDISGALVLDTAATTGITLSAVAMTTGISIAATGLTTGILLSSACTSAQIKVEGTAIIASGEQAIYVNCVAETAAVNGVWSTIKSTVSSGDLTSGRFKAHTLRLTSGGPNVRAVYGQALADTTDNFAALLQGGLFVAGYTGANTTATNIYGVTGFISQGEGLLGCTNLAAVQAHVQTRGDETITLHTGVLITNEAVGGNGRTMNSAIRITESSMGGGTKSFDVLIDATGVNTTIHDTDQTDLIKFRDSGGTERKIVFDPTNSTVLEVQTA